LNALREGKEDVIAQRARQLLESVRDARTKRQNAAAEKQGSGGGRA
jgi:hypothetical protein